MTQPVLARASSGDQGTSGHKRVLGAGKADSGYFPFHRRVILPWGHNVNDWVHPLVFVLPSTVEPRLQTLA